MLLEAGPVRALGVDNEPLLRFGEEPKAPGTWAGKRLLWMAGKPAFELSYWCGTCQFLFKRLDGANQTCSLEEVEDRLTEGLAGIDHEVVEAFGALLPAGNYLPLLVQVQPRLVRPAGPGDYFAEEQVSTWGLSSFWGLPEYPQTPYYRTFETAVDPTAHLFEFIVPMVPPSWNDRRRVDAHSARLQNSSTPTAVAVSTLDVCQPATDQGVDYFAHWSLTHFLLDGHHKLQAAAETSQPLQLLALLSLDSSLAEAEQVNRIAKLRAAPFASRNGA